MIFVLEGEGGSFKDWSSQGSLKRGVKVCSELIWQIFFFEGGRRIQLKTWSLKGRFVGKVHSFTQNWWHSLETASLIYPLSIKSIQPGPLIPQFGWSCK